MTAFDRATLDEIASSQPAWRADQMADAFASFEAQDLPSGAEEDWKYVEVGFDLDGLVPAGPGGSPMPSGPFLSAAEKQVAGKVIMVDGYVTDLSVDSVAQVRRVGELDGVDFAAAVDRDKFAAGHLAFAPDGIRVDVPDGVDMEAPLLIDVQATQDATMSFPHIEVNVGANAEGRVLVVYRSPDDIEAVAVPGVTLTAGDGGRLRFMSVQGWGTATTGLVHQRVRLGRDATGRIGEVGLGGRYARLDLNVDLEGAGASTEVVGLYFGENDQTLDYRLVINHIGRNTSSDVFQIGRAHV